MTAPRPTVLLGPQRLDPILNDVLTARGLDGPLAIVTAGWEERELEDTELAEHVDRDVRNLEVWGRVEDVFRRDPELLEAVRARHDRLRKSQTFYRMRLSHQLEAARELLGREEADTALIEPERAGAIEAVRRLDSEHLERIHEIHAEFEERWRPGERDHVARHREELRRALGGVSGLCIAGGHVAILLNRMRLLDVLGGAGELPIVAWSAGAMVLGERVVLFHDSPPQGPGDAEVLEAGFGLCRDVVPLPHASRRLRLGDRTRVELFARRFGPATCVVLDDRAGVSYDEGRLAPEPGTKRLTVSGLVEELEAA